MNDPSSASTRRSTETDAITFGPIHLDITTKERGLAFWRDVIGLRLISDAGSGLELGVEDEVMIVLHPGATRPLDRNRSGLYHLAIHLPTVDDYARMAVRVQHAGMHQYPVDHLMHLANYVDDHDGNGLEIVFETRERYGSMEIRGNDAVFLDADGKPHSGREQVDLQRLIAEAPVATDEHAPSGSFLGHIHLRVADLDETVAFYRDQIGLIPNMHVPGFSMFDMSAGGTFPHRLAGNVWESKGQPVKDADTAGLRQFTLTYRSAADVNAALTRLRDFGANPIFQDGGHLVTDPSGISLTLTAQAI